MRTSTFALFLGIAYLSIGLLGLIPAALMPPSAEAPPVRFNWLYGELFGLFAVNVAHSIAHLATGAWGIMAWRGIGSPKLFARSIAILYGALALMGLIPGVDTLFGVLPMHGHDVWLHLASAALAAHFGWRREAAVEHRASTREDRRSEVLPVEHEHRVRQNDRRLPFNEV